MIKMDVRSGIKDNIGQSEDTKTDLIHGKELHVETNLIQEKDHGQKNARNKISCDPDAVKAPPDNCDSNVGVGDVMHDITANQPAAGDIKQHLLVDNIDCDLSRISCSDTSSKCSGSARAPEHNMNLPTNAVASTSRYQLDNKANEEAQTNDMENNEITPVLPTVSSRDISEMMLFVKQERDSMKMETDSLKVETDSLKQESEISESDIQSTCSTGNLNESRESVFYSDQSSESNAPGAAVIKNVDNTSLCNLLIYTSEDSESDSSTDEELEGYESPFEERGLETPTSKPGKQPLKGDTKITTMSETLRAMGDLNLEELPPVPDPRSIKLDIQEKDCEKMGTISSVIDEIVMVESLPNMPAFDMDTLLFLDKGKQPLGYVYDTVGPVSQPLYAIRFNTVQEIQALNISKGLPVYSAPKTEHSQYVFLKELIKMKGSDASWKHDMEVPAEYADFSDDEQEQVAKRGGKKTDPKKTGSSNKKRNSLERHQNFEKDMNVRNLIDTRLHKIRDTYEPANKKYVPQSQTAAPQNFTKRGFPFQPTFRPAFSFTTQPNSPTPVPSFAQMPHVSGLFGMATPAFARPTLPMPAFANLPPNVATFVPHMPPPLLPPHFRPNIPPPTITQQTMAGQTMTPHTITPHTMTPHTMTPHTITPHSITPHSISPHSITHAMTPHSITHTPHTMGQHTMVSHTMAPHTMTPHTMTLQTMSHSTMTPRSMTRTSMVPDNVPPPAMFQTFSTPPPPMDMGVSKQADSRQSNTPLCVYPTNLGLPRPQPMAPQPPMLVTSHSGNSIPPNLTFYRSPQIRGWYSWPNPMPHPPNGHGRSYAGGGRGCYPHKRP